MPVPMNKANFRERVEQARDAVGLLRFQAPPATNLKIEAPDAEDIWRVLQLVEQIIRNQRALTVENVAKS